MPKVWGIHMEWDDGTVAPDAKDVAIGWHEIGALTQLSPTREAFKAAFARTFVMEKPGAIPVKAGVLYRFFREMKPNDVIVYPSKADRKVNIGTITSDYFYATQPNPDHPHRRKAAWKVHVPRENFTQKALYEIGSALTLFEISNNTDEFLNALAGAGFTSPEVETDTAAAAEIATQAQESVEDFVLKRLKSGITPAQFEQFVAGLLRCLGYYARVTPYSGDGGVDIVAHKDELGFEPPIIKAQCKQMISTVGAPDVQRLLGAVQEKEFALFVTLGEFSSDARKLEAVRSNLRLIKGSDLVLLIFNNYEKLDPQFKAMLPMRKTYIPSVILHEKQDSDRTGK